MAEIVNLRRVRKNKSRASAEAEAEANRVRHGVPKRLRKLAEKERQKVDRETDARKLDRED